MDRCSVLRVQNINYVDMVSYAGFISVADMADMVSMAGFIKGVENLLSFFVYEYFQQGCGQGSAGMGTETKGMGIETKEWGLR